MVCTNTAPASSTSLLSLRIIRVRTTLELNAREKLIARVLLDYIGNRPDGTCWPSRSTIAREASVSVRTVQTAINGLRDKGFISIAHRHREDGGQTSSLYQWVDALGSSASGAEVAQGGGKTSTQHKTHPKKPNKPHVSACISDSVQGDAKVQPAVPAGTERTNGFLNRRSQSEHRTSKRFASFETNPEKFKTFDACADACDSAVSAGFIEDTEIDRLLFWTVYAAVCRKMKAGKVNNPARLLRFLLDSRKSMVTYSSQADEDSARKALRAFLRTA